MNAGLPLHHTPFLPRWSSTALVPAVPGTLGISPGAGQPYPGERLPVKRWVSPADPGPADPGSCWSWLPWPSHHLFSTVWVCWNIKPWWECWHCWAWHSSVPHLVLSFNPSVFLVGKQGHTRLCDAFLNLSAVKLLENACLHLSHCSLLSLWAANVDLGLKLFRTSIPIFPIEKRSSVKTKISWFP